MSKLDAFLESLDKTAETIKTAEVEKTAEELHLEKLANQNETIEASTVLGLIGEDFCKEAENGSLLYACGETLIDASQAMTLGLQKVAAENSEGMIVDMVETQDGLQKVAHVLAEMAEEVNDEEFTKMASAVVEINNTLFDELDKLAETDESVAAYLAEFHKEASEKELEKEAAMAGAKAFVEKHGKEAWESAKNIFGKAKAGVDSAAASVSAKGKEAIESTKLHGAALAAHLEKNKAAYIAGGAAGTAGAAAGYLAGRKKK